MHALVSCAVHKGHCEMVKTLCEFKPPLHLKDPLDHITLLQRAIQNKKPDMVKELLAQGANPNEDILVGMMMKPLHLAAQMRQLDIMNILLSGGADIDGLDEDGATALQVSCSCNATEEALFLLDRGANRAIKDDYLLLPIDFAQSHENQELVARLS